MTWGDGTVKADVPIYGGLAAAPPAKVPLPAPASAGGTSPIDAGRGLLDALGNMGVPGDAADTADGDADRRAHAADAAAKFPANEADSAQQMQAVGAQAGGQQGAQMIQQVVSSITGALGGAVGGIMGPLTQLPQQAMQAGQSAMQPLMSAVQGAHGAGALAGESELTDSVGTEPAGGGGFGGGAGAGGLGAGGGGGGGTTPTSSLGPPPVPSSSPPTTPAAAKAPMVTPPSGAPTAAAPSGMTGMPMVPPGAMGHGGEGANKEKPAEKRITAPGVPNGQPVKGRLTVPPSAPVTKPGEGKPTVVTNRPNRRIVIVPNEDEPKD